MRTDSFIWRLPSADASTGAQGWHNTKGLSDAVTFYIKTSSASSGNVVFQTALSTAPETNASTGSVGVLGPSTGYTLSTRQTQAVTFTQPLAYVRPRITGRSSGAFTIQLIGNGQW